MIKTIEVEIFQEEKIVIVLLKKEFGLQMIMECVDALIVNVVACFVLHFEVLTIAFDYLSYHQE